MAEVIRRQCYRCGNCRVWNAESCQWEPTCECETARTTLVIRCSCGCELLLDSGWSNECHCGREYNGGGQLLAPRSQWGEETGESMADMELNQEGALDES